MLAVIYSRGKVGIEAPQVMVEVHISNGLPAFAIVGLPETAVKESKDRVRSAIINSGFDFPCKRITVNLAPADLPKEGGRYDLPIALGILAASEQISQAKLESYEFIAELALTGKLRQVLGVLPALSACGRAERSLILAKEGLSLGGLGQELSQKTLVANHLTEVTGFLNNAASLPLANDFLHLPHPIKEIPDLKEITGQTVAKRALTLAAAGQHNLLFYGPPGTGKTMLARRLPGILPPLNAQQSLEVASLQSLLGQTGHFGQRPFRTPHHSASAIALIGGGQIPRPGEISLAHQGVLFLDELPEFQRATLEMLREPMESGEIHISRAKLQVSFPAQFQLLAAMNPCPCGYLGDKRRSCRCSPNQIERYRQKISGPLLDRIDMQVEVASLNAEQMLNRPKKTNELSSKQVQALVTEAWQKQIKRQGKSNSKLSAKELEKFCPLSNPQKKMLSVAIERFGLSARSMHRIMRLARTVADLNLSDKIETQHLQEALSYRSMDRPVVNKAFI